MALVLGVAAWTLVMGLPAFAQEEPFLSEEKITERATVAWESVSIQTALTILDQGLHDHPDAFRLYKLRGDILATSRRSREAVEAYDLLLAKAPAALDVRWAKWSVLFRGGHGDESLAELQRIAELDVRNPLVHLRLAQELRKLDRLEESVLAYTKAVALAPEVLSWRLGLARARFDVLDYQGAHDDVQFVLHKLSPGSPLEIPAQELLSAVFKPASDRGRRSEVTLSDPDVAPAERKEWGLIRGEAWRLFSAGRYKEAEPLYRRLLVLNPKDPTATHQLGLTLMKLGRCEEALSILQAIPTLNPNDEDYADAVFRMGQCLVELKRWLEAFVYFQVLYDAAVEFEEANKNLRLPYGTRVLSKEKLARWLDKVRPHVPEADRMPPEVPPPAPGVSEEDYLAQIAARPLKPQKPLDMRVSLMGRDSDFSWFLFVIPASKVMRDDFPTGDHEFIPLNPGDSFPTTQPEIDLVFRLATPSADAMPLSAQCFLESSEVTGEARALARDDVIMSMNDQSGYFKLSRPKTGWTPGLYRCGLFAGDQKSAYTHVDEVRFRILDPPRPS